MKKVVCFITALTLALCAFTGCSKKDAAKDSKGDGDVVKLEMYYYKQENQEGLATLVKKFEAANPGVKIDLLIIPNDADAMMSARAAQGKLPDILQMQSYSRVQEYAKAGFLVDLTSSDVMTKVNSGYFPAVTYEDKQFAVPMDVAGIGIIYNKDIFAKYGIASPTTYRELQAACKTLKDNNIVPFAALLKENWSVGHFITMIQTALLLEKGTDYNKWLADMNAGKASYGDVDTAKLFSVLDFYRANMNSNAEEMGGGEQQQSFANGESAMMVNGLWAYLDAKKLNPSINAGFMPFPVSNDASKNLIYADVDSCWGLSAQSSKEKQAAAMKFLDWLATKDGEASWIGDYKLTCSFKDADMSVLGGPYVDLAACSAKGTMPWMFAQYPTVVFEDACKNGAQQYMMKSKSAEKVIADIDSQWREAVATK